MRSVHLHKDKSIFKLAELPAERFAESLGLPGAPKIKFLSKEVAKQKKNKSRAVEAVQAEILKEKADAEDESGSESDDDDGAVHDSSEEEEEPAAVPLKPTKVFFISRVKADFDTDLFILARCGPYEIRPDVRAEKSKHSFRALLQTHRPPRCWRR
jgi:hypothetical protein